MKLHENLKEIRKLRKLTQMDLASEDINFTTSCSAPAEIVSLKDLEAAMKALKENNNSEFEVTKELAAIPIPFKDAIS